MVWVGRYLKDQIVPTPLPWVKTLRKLKASFQSCKMLKSRQAFSGFADAAFFPVGLFSPNCFFIQVYYPSLLPRY